MSIEEFNKYFLLPVLDKINKKKRICYMEILTLIFEKVILTTIYHTFYRHNGII